MSPKRTKKKTGNEDKIDAEFKKIFEKNLRKDRELLEKLAKI